MSPAPFKEYCDKVQLGESGKIFPTTAMPLIIILELVFNIDNYRAIRNQYGIEQPYNHYSRRYKAYWVVENNQLFLKDVEGSVLEQPLIFKNLFSKNIDIEGNPTLHFASWYSGKMKIIIEDYQKHIEGKEYHILSERTLLIEKGLVVSHKDKFTKEELVEYPF